MESIFTAAGNWLGLVELLEACFMGREEHRRASGLHSGTNWSFGSHAAAFGLRPALCLVLGWAEDWGWQVHFPKGPQLRACPDWTKKIINYSTNPFRPKIQFQKIFVKCSLIPWEQLQSIFSIHICKIIPNTCIYFYKRLSSHKVLTGSSVPARLSL